MCRGQVGFTLGFMLYINVQLALACFAVVPAQIVVSKIFGEYMRTISRQSQARRTATTCPPSRPPLASPPRLPSRLPCPPPLPLAIP